MTNPFFDPGTGRAARVNALFSRIAPRYDLINDLQSFGLHRHWKQRLVSLSGAGPDTPVLDVCCGTGDLALRFAQTGATVTGLDFTRPMLDVARQRDPGGRVCWVQGDAQALPFPANTFQAVSVGYGLRNLAQWEQGLAEMCRVTAPGGRVLVLDFGKPDNRVWRALYFGYLRLFVPLLGLVFCGSAGAYAYILESLRHYPAQHGVATAMKQLGLVDTGIVSFLGGVMTINYGRKA